MPRKTFFKTNGNKSTKSLPESTTRTARQEQGTTPTPAPIPTPTPTITSWTEAALEKANMAVLYDFTGAPKKAMDAYNEAIVLLDKVFESANNCIDQTRLKKIYNSYTNRVLLLTQQLNNNELDPTPSVSIPVAQLSHETPPIDPPPAKTQRKPPSLNLTDHDLSEPATPISCHLTFNKKQLDIPPPLPPKSPKVHPPKSPSNSLFGSMFLKKQSSKPHLQAPTPSHSKSTPILSTNQPTISWKKQSPKKKNRYSTLLDTPNTESIPFSSKLELPSFTLPDVEIQKGDDYFDLQSTMATKSLFFSTPEPILTSMHDLHQGEMEKPDDDQLDDGKLYENAGNFYENDTNTTTEQGDINAATVTRERSTSSSSSGNTTATIKYQSPQLISSASSTLTSNSSIYLPTSLPFSPSTFISLDEDILSSVPSKSLPPPQPSLLPDINSGTSLSSFFDRAHEQDVDTLTKYLAESAATMPGRSHRTTCSTMVPSISAVIEETELEPSSSIQHSLPFGIPNDSQQQHSPTVLLSPSTTTKSTTSVKSCRSSYSLKRNKKTTTKDDGSSTPPTPTPSNSTKTISFWSKRSTATTTTTSSSKQKTMTILPPLHFDHHTDDSSSWMIVSPPILSQPSTPKSMTSSIDHTLASPRTSTSSSSGFKRPIVHPLQPPSHAFGAHATQTATNKGIDVNMTMTTLTMNKNDKQPKLMARLQQSMEQGGYITDRLHVPKQLWCQKQVRLPAMDAKITTCEQLVTVLERMHAITRLLDQLDLSQQDITTEALHTLGRVESILDTIKQTFGKRHHDHPPSSTVDASHGKYLTNTTTSPPPPPTTTTSFKDPMTAWGSKLSKSVERMKIETKSSEEQIHAYRSTLIRLFTLSNIFDRWRDIFTALLGKVAMDKMHLYDQLLQKTMMCSGTFHTVVCYFVMQDLYLLLDKWLKRNRDWLLD